LNELSLDVHLNANGEAIVVVGGEVDMATAPQLDEALCTQVDRDVIVDLSAVAFLDSSGIGALVHARTALAANGHTLRVTGEHDNVKLVLEVTGLLATLHGED
jgi:anti-sigma B factor antagonist